MLEVISNWTGYKAHTFFRITNNREEYDQIIPKYHLGGGEGNLHDHELRLQ